MGDATPTRSHHPGAAQIDVRRVPPEDRADRTLWPEAVRLPLVPDSRGDGP